MYIVQSCPLDGVKSNAKCLTVTCEPEAWLTGLPYIYCHSHDIISTRHCTNICLGK